MLSSSIIVLWLLLLLLLSSSVHEAANSYSEQMLHVLCVSTHVGVFLDDDDDDEERGVYMIL